MPYDRAHENAKRCPQCGGAVRFLHVLMKVRRNSGWRHHCARCGDMGYIPDPPRTDEEMFLEHLTQLKTRLMALHQNGNPLPPDSERRRVVRMSELRNPPSDDWKRGQADAFDALWSTYCELEARAIAMGLVEGRIEPPPGEY